MGTQEIELFLIFRQEQFKTENDGKRRKMTESDEKGRKMTVMLIERWPMENDKLLDNNFDRKY